MLINDYMLINDSSKHPPYLNFVPKFLHFIFLLKGFLVGSYGLTWALKHQSKISKLAILNTPLTISSPLPGLFQQLRFYFYPKINASYFN